jgi:hypothetical protein
VDGEASKKMNPKTLKLNFDGELLQRGFWLYVWEIQTPNQTTLYYVGRTGDSSSINAQSPFNRMGQHLGFNDKSNVLRRHLEGKNFDPETCSFQLIAYGPILKEAKTKDEHRKRRDSIASMEKALADEMTAVGYNVINTVNCRKKLDVKKFVLILNAFARQFNMLNGKKKPYKRCE